MEEEPASAFPQSWVSMTMRVRHQWPHRNMLYDDLRQMLTSMLPSSGDTQQGVLSSLKELSVGVVLASDNLSWHLACTCPTGMFDYVMEAMVKELALRYHVNSGQRLQYNLTRSIVRLSLHCIHNVLSLVQFLRNIANLFDSNWFRWGRFPSNDIAAMWAFYAELADAMAVGYVVPRLYDRELPMLSHLDLSGIPRLRDSTWSLKTIYDAGNKELNPLLGDMAKLQLTLDLEVEGPDRKQLRLLHKLAMDRRRAEEGDGGNGGDAKEGGRFLVGVKHVYVTSLSQDCWGTLLEDVQSFPELCHLTLNMCQLNSGIFASLQSLNTILTGLALPNNPDISDLDGLQQFARLQVLDLCNLDLRGLMLPITQLSTPLTYLGVSGCRLGPVDLQTLAGSRHCASLRQLDVSENSARGKPDMVRAYVSLMQSLGKVEVLNLSHCHLPDHGAELQGAVEGALRSLSSLHLIAFSPKDFAANTSLRSVIELMDCKIFFT